MQNKNVFIIEEKTKKEYFILFFAYLFVSLRHRMQAHSWAAGVLSDKKQIALLL